MSENDKELKFAAAPPTIPNRKTTAPLNPNIIEGEELFSRGTDAFPEDGQLQLEIPHEPKPLVFQVSKDLILGRRDPALPVQPEVDLSLVAGYRMGVSRRHARISRTSEGFLVLIDLGSANGTLLNETRLLPHHSYRLHDGDKVVLGQLVMYLHFQAL